MKILCIWSSRDWKPVFTDEKELVYKNGEYSIFKRRESYLYTWNNVSFTELVGFNKELIDSLIFGEKREGVSKFIYERSLETLKRAKKALDKHGN